MKEIQLKMILFFVKRGLSIEESCKRINKTRREFYYKANRTTELYQVILRARTEYKALYQTISSQTFSYVKEVINSVLIFTEDEQIILDELAYPLSYSINTNSYDTAKYYEF